MTPWRAIYKMLIKYIFFLERKKQDEVNSKLLEEVLIERTTDETTFYRLFYALLHELQ